MEFPVLQGKTRPGSLSNTQSTSRSYFEPRFDRSQTYPTSLSNARTPTDNTNSFYTQPASLPPRSFSWDVAQYRAASNSPGRQAPLLRPRRLSTGSRLRSFPGEAASRLPKEILILIFIELRKLHLEGRDGGTTCPTCYMRDMCSLSLTSRKWSSAAKMVLYETIILVGNDSSLHLKKKFKMKYGSRLTILRRTLRANAQISAYVKNLKVPEIPEVAIMKKEQDN